jgi:hypothetical protein
MRKEIFTKGKYKNLKIKKIGPCKILKKFVVNAYDLEFLEGIGISLIFKVADLYPYSMDDTEEINGHEEIQWKQHMPITEKPQIENILDQKIDKRTIRKMYYEYLIKWKDHLEENVSWIIKADIQKHGKTRQELMDKSP